MRRRRYNGMHTREEVEDEPCPNMEEETFSLKQRGQHLIVRKGTKKLKKKMRSKIPGKRFCQQKFKDT